MENIQDLLRSAHMTKTQKIIAEYILDNASDACFMTSTEIALKLGVSESSVIRFSRTIGFSGFIDFQKALRKDYQDKVSPAVSRLLPRELPSRQNWILLPNILTDILKMPPIIWKKFLFRILFRTLKKLLI